ncbi:Pyoverdine/dityrosine biosynthesis protein-domain-containing protein [Auriculariales sp. MPI-PUGE-AT-0066]|nr:Pyoverdine/dityrosine biosynthesis protein-domain-containing protein [Auriculariales sp. MPI-PUGE-AT-0066]
MEPATNISHQNKINGRFQKVSPTTNTILNILHRYRLQTDASHGTEVSVGDPAFLSQIHDRLTRRVPFTCASLLSHLRVALAHLNGLCASITDVYKPGATLTIISDGLVYNDLLGVSDKAVWAYGQALRGMVITKGYSHIRFSRLQDLVHLRLSNISELEEMTYVANATNFRSALLNKFGRPDYDASSEIGSNEDTCVTSKGYKKFLENDLRHVFPVGAARSKTKFKAGTEYIAKQMLQRGDAFARAVHENFGDCLRLSIHPSNGEKKLSISTLPTQSIFTTPWHCTIADLLDWNSEVTIEPLYPPGWMIRPANGPNTLSILNVEAQKVRALSERNSPVILRGFSGTTSRDAYVSKAEEFGTLLPWKFKTVLEVMDQGQDSRGMNNVLSSEWMPFHYDGVFKGERKTSEDGTVKFVPNPPRFQFFTSVTPSPKDTGFTLFAGSRLIFANLPNSLPLSRLQQLTWTVTTPSFDAANFTGLPLITSHPTTGEPCLRYHEPWPQFKTAFEAVEVTIEGVNKDENKFICETLDELMHDRSVCYWHAWEKGDLLFSDNTLMHHTRSDFTSGASRELWRIHID